MKNERPTRELEWTEMLEKALTIPGSVGSSYSRFYNYSYMNTLWLFMQGIEPQPVATYKRWQELGRQVVKGARAREIIRPIVIDKKDEHGEKTGDKFLRFKPVRCIFPLEDTTGPDLPPLETPEWSLDRALENLEVERVPFTVFDGNTAGYSYGKSLALNPVGTHPLKTAHHELAHIVSGHTTPERSAEYQQHRGHFEFEAEGSAYLVMNELDVLTESEAVESRGYIQGWMRGAEAKESSIKTIFKTTDVILKAGRLAIAEAVEVGPLEAAS